MLMIYFIVFLSLSLSRFTNRQIQISRFLNQKPEFSRFGMHVQRAKLFRLEKEAEEKQYSELSMPLNAQLPIYFVVGPNHQA